MRGNDEAYFTDGETFDLRELGPVRATSLLATLPQEVVAEALDAIERAGDVSVPGQVQALADERQQARVHHDWAKADQLRTRIEALGWQVQDTPDGPKVLPASAAGSAEP
jgi:cysteinyl-tRNA synthetase